VVLKEIENGAAADSCAAIATVLEATAVTPDGADGAMAADVDTVPSSHTPSPVLPTSLYRHEKQ